MAGFTGRSLFYQVSILLLLLATAVYCLGVALPWWTQTYSKITRTVTRHSGLWLTCSMSSGPQSADDKCRPIEAPSWFRVVQGMQAAGLTAVAAASTYALVVNFCKDQLNSSKAVEILAGTGGILGIISATVFVTKTSTILKHGHGISYSWAFSLDFAASVLVLIIAVFIALANRRPSAHDADEAAKVIVEDWGGGHEVEDIRSRSPERHCHRGGGGGGGGGGALVMQRSPARTRRLEAISETFVSLEEEEDEEEEEVGKSSKRPSSYVNSAGEVARSDSRTDTV